MGIVHQRGSLSGDPVEFTAAADGLWGTRNLQAAPSSARSVPPSAYHKPADTARLRNAWG
eukprot:1839474-Prorocentrum_lima.AAC.1